MHLCGDGILGYGVQMLWDAVSVAQGMGSACSGVWGRYAAEYRDIPSRVWGAMGHRVHVHWDGRRV